MVFLRLASTVLALTLITSASNFLPAFAADSVKGTVIIARATGHALMLLDSTRELTDLAAKKTLPADEVRSIEADAVRAMVSNRKAFAKRTATVSVRVIYQHTGAVDPRYGTPTLEGVERLMTLEAPLGSIARNASRWLQDIAAGRTPGDGLHVTIEGKVPGQ